MTTTRDAVYASPVDTDHYGSYTITRSADDPRPLYRFRDRLSADGSTGYLAEPGRYHLYAGWFCPWAQRVVLELALNGLTEVVTVSYVDGQRDGRGWAFRERHGADPVNGFTLLRDAYEATQPGFDGHISVPTLWDTRTNRVVSNDFVSLGLDVATEFDRWKTPGVDTYPAQLRTEIAALDRWIGPAVNRGVSTASGTGPDAEQARTDLRAALGRLDELLTGRDHLVGGAVTEADVRLYVTLVRYDVQANAAGQVGPPLAAYPELARYTAGLYALPAFAATTDFSTFAVDGAEPSFLDRKKS